VYYDSDGELYAGATLGGSAEEMPHSLFRFTVGSLTAPGQCGGTSATLTAFSDDDETTASPGYGDYIYREGLSIGLGAYGWALRNRSYSCMTLTISDAAGKVLDALDVPLFFDGTGPDGDGDGVADNVDKCPATAGPAPTGCVPDSDGDTVIDGADQCPGIFGLAPTGCPAAAPLPGPPGIVTTQPADPAPKPAKRACSAVSLKGKSLPAARKALGKAGCKLGKVIKPRKVRKGARLVVVRQSGRNPVAITLGAEKKK
jgi:hypothetical protein